MFRRIMTGSTALVRPIPSIPAFHRVPLRISVPVFSGPIVPVRSMAVAAPLAVSDQKQPKDDKCDWSLVLKQHAESLHADPATITPYADIARLCHLHDVIPTEAILDNFIKLKNNLRPLELAHSMLFTISTSYPKLLSQQVVSKLIDTVVYNETLARVIKIALERQNSHHSESVEKLINIQLTYATYKFLAKGDLERCVGTALSLFPLDFDAKKLEKVARILFYISNRNLEDILDFLRKFCAEKQVDFSQAEAIDILARQAEKLSADVLDSMKLWLPNAMYEKEVYSTTWNKRKSISGYKKEDLMLCFELGLKSIDDLALLSSYSNHCFPRCPTAYVDPKEIRLLEKYSHEEKSILWEIYVMATKISDHDKVSLADIIAQKKYAKDILKLLDILRQASQNKSYVLSLFDWKLILKHVDNIKYVNDLLSRLVFDFSQFDSLITQSEFNLRRMLVECKDRDDVSSSLLAHQGFLLAKVVMSPEETTLLSKVPFGQQKILSRVYAEAARLNQQGGISLSKIIEKREYAKDILALLEVLSREAIKDKSYVLSPSNWNAILEQAHNVKHINWMLPDEDFDPLRVEWLLEKADLLQDMIDILKQCEDLTEEFSFYVSMVAHADRETVKEIIKEIQALDKKGLIPRTAPLTFDVFELIVNRCEAANKKDLKPTNLAAGIFGIFSAVGYSLYNEQVEVQAEKRESENSTLARLKG